MCEWRDTTVSRLFFLIWCARSCIIALPPTFISGCVCLRWLHTRAWTTSLSLVIPLIFFRSTPAGAAMMTSRWRTYYCCLSNNHTWTAHYHNPHSYRMINAILSLVSMDYMRSNHELWGCSFATKIGAVLAYSNSRIHEKNQLTNRKLSNQQTAERRVGSLAIICFSLVHLAFAIYAIVLVFLYVCECCSHWVIIIIMSMRPTVVLFMPALSSECARVIWSVVRWLLYERWRPKK